MGERRALGRIRRQYGIISRSQALAAGMTVGQINFRLSSGRWTRVARGVYHHRAVPLTPLSRLLAACIAHRGLASHRSAAALHGVEGFAHRRPEVAVRRGQKPAMGGVTLHESLQLDLAQPMVRNGIPCTGLARTVLDVAAVVSSNRLGRTIDAVLRDRRLRLIDLRWVLDTHCRRGRNGCAALRRALEERFGDEPVPLSDWSRMVADVLVAHGLEYPALEYRIHSENGAFVAQVDLAYPSRRLAIELDSRRWHLDYNSFVNDRRRRNQTTIAGWTVLNFTWSDYASRPEELCAVVTTAYNSRKP